LTLSTKLELVETVLPGDSIGVLPANIFPRQQTGNSVL